MNVGYAYWGFLGDIKYDADKKASTPDGNAFYSWAIIYDLLKRGHNVFRLMPDRDVYGLVKHGNQLFQSWCQEERFDAYIHAEDIAPYYSVNIKSERAIKKLIEEKIKSLDIILLEWRFKIPGRNTKKDIKNDNFQPDLIIQKCILDIAAKYGIKTIIFDLDYKLSLEDIPDNLNYTIFELGNKWSANDGKRVEIPFLFDAINKIAIRNVEQCNTDIVYIGNRYERDWCIDKYFNDGFDDLSLVVYGNWLESGRDSQEKWEKIKFGERLQPGEMKDAYNHAVATVLFAKKEYCEMGFMTARLLEAVFYGCVPFFICEYGTDVIEKYAGIRSNFLIVHDKYELESKVKLLKNNNFLRYYILSDLREHLKFMDVKNFNDLLEMEAKKC